MYLPLKHPIWPFETIDFKMAAVLDIMRLLSFEQEIPYGREDKSPIQTLLSKQSL